MEKCNICIEPQTVSTSVQTDYEEAVMSLNHESRDEPDLFGHDYVSEKLIDNLINPSVKENALTPDDIESMAISMMIAFQADKHTLERRLEIQTRLRDQSEINVANEISSLHSIIKELKAVCGEESDKDELITKLEEQIEILHRSATYISSVAEMFGAVQQEKRLFNAMEVISRYVENLKQNLVNEKLLHQQTSKLLSENKPLNCNSSISLDPKRRASIAAVDNSPTESCQSSRKGSLIKRFASCKSNSFSELQFNLRKGETDSLVSSMNIDNSLDSDIDNEVSDCIDNSCSCINAQPSREIEEIYGRKRSVRLEENTMSTITSQRKSSQHPIRYKFQKRGSFLGPRWFIKFAEARGWNHDMEDVANKVRYSAACALIVAAFAVLSYSFIASDSQSV